MKPISYGKNEINIKKYKKGKEISRGRFGVVYEVEEIETKKLYAAKLIFREKEEEYNELTKHEFTTIFQMRHQAIAKFIGYSTIDFDDQNNIVIFMKLAENGSLSNIITNTMMINEEIKNYTNTIRQINLIGITLGMKYLHDNNIIHGDLKPENVLLDAEFHPLITDFGLSKYLNIEHLQSNRSIPYQAPEILKGDSHNEKVDVYSFGILMFEVISNSFAYPELINGQISDSELKDKIINDHYRPKFTFPIKKQIQQLIESCWSDDPKNRPSFGEILKKVTKTDTNDYLLDDVDIDELNNYIKEITDSKDILKKYEDEIQNLRLENDQNRLKINKLEQENQNFKDEICYLKELNDINEQEKQQLNDIITQLKTKKEDNSRQFNSIKETNQKLKSETETKKEEIKQLQTIINNLLYKGPNNQNNEEQPQSENPLILGKCYEKHSNLEHEFRQLIYNIEQNGNEILYLFEEEQGHKNIKTQIDDQLNKFKAIICKLLEEKKFSKKNEIITNFYKSNIKNISNLRQLIIKELYPQTITIYSEFQKFSEEQYCFDFDSFFQSFDPQSKKDSNLIKLSYIEPPKNYDSKIKDEELLIKYDKFVCIINMIVSLCDFIKFETKFNRAIEECSKEEQTLSNEQNKSMNKQIISNNNKPEQIYKLISLKEFNDEKIRIEREKKKIEEELKFIKEEKIKFDEKKKQFDEKMKRKAEEEDKMNQKININLNNRIEIIKKDEEKLKIQKEKFENERKMFISWRSEIESLVITDKQFLQRIDELENRIISINIPNPLAILNKNSKPSEEEIQSYFDKIKDLNILLAKIKSEMVEIKVISQKYMLNYANLADENTKILQFVQAHNLHYKSDSNEKKQCNIF